MFQKKIEVNGKTYILQHPGNREFQKIAGTMMKISDKGTYLDTLPIMDFAFENCVIPQGDAPKLSVDGKYKDGQKPNAFNTTEEESIAWMREYEEVWVRILPSFLRGTLETTVFWSKDRQGNSGASVESEAVETHSQSDVSKVGSSNRRTRNSKLPGSE